MEPSGHSKKNHPSYPALQALQAMHLLVRLEEECMAEPWNERMIESQYGRANQLILFIDNKHRIFSKESNSSESRKAGPGAEAGTEAGTGAGNETRKSNYPAPGSPDNNSMEAGTAEDSAEGICGYIWMEDRSMPVGEDRKKSDDLDSENQWELLRIGVLPDFRGFGLAKRLIQSALQGSWQGTPDRVLLEVAQTNESARALYESCGFLIINRRKNYYMDSDALIMERKERSHET